MKRVSRQDYDAFRWLPIERWNEDTLFGPMMGNRIMCKICDEYIGFDDRKVHAEKHATVRKRQIEGDRKKAREARLAAAKLAREEKKRLQQQ